MKIKLLFFLGLVLPVLIIPAVVFGFTDVKSFSVNVVVENCNSNGTCEPLIGEDYSVCAADCPFGCNNNSTCESEYGETNINCVNDCPVCIVNGTCEADIGETIINCSADCTTPICNNNGTCDIGAGETVSNCVGDCYVTPVVPVSGGGGVMNLGNPPQILNLAVRQLNQTSIKLSWDTDILASCMLNWREDNADFFTKKSEISYSFAHQFVINDLVFGLDYRGQINCFNTNKVESQLKNIFFRIEKTPEIPRINYGIKNLKATALDSSVSFIWYPIDSVNYQGVMVRRSDWFFPSNVNQGGILYKGAGDKNIAGYFFYKDTNLKNGKRYYYTFFPYDIAGNYLPGLSVSVLPQSKEMVKPVEDLSIPPIILTPEISIPLVKAVVTPTPKFSDYVFFQNNQSVPTINNTVKVSTGTILSVLLDAKKVLPLTRNILMTIEDKGEYQTYFLEKLADGSYIVSYPSQTYLTKQRVYFTYLNDKNEAITRVSGNLLTEEKKIEAVFPSLVSKPSVSSLCAGFCGLFGLEYHFWFCWIWLVILLIVLLFLATRWWNKK